jgi:hypothetical protein
MADDLRDRVLAAVRKGLAGSLDTSKTKKPGLQGYSVDSATENGVTAEATCNTDFPNQIKDVTPLHPFSANSDSQPGKVLAEPTLAYRATSTGPDGIGCGVEIVEIPATGLRHRRTFAHLQLRPPAYIPEDRWRLAVDDGKRFLAKWGEQAESLGWTSADLFGLIEIPERPSLSFNRLSRYDRLGLCWALQGREVVALTADTATIKSETGNITTYRRFNKPALGPLGDSLEDFK